MNRTEVTVRVLCLPDSDSTFELCGKLTDWNGRVTQKPYLISRAFAKCERGMPHPAKGLETTFQSISCGLYAYQIMDGKISILVFQ